MTTLVIGSLSCMLANDSWVVREEGTGPVKIGMDLSQLNAVLREKFTLPAEKNEQACFYVIPRKHPLIAFMIVDGQLARIDVSSRNIPTVAGIRIGDSEKKALQVYGRRLKVEPHAYTAPDGHYLTLRSSDGRYGIRFETHNGEIIRFYAGRIDAIQFIEGCS